MDLELRLKTANTTENFLMAQRLPRLNGFSLKTICSLCENGFRIETENFLMAHGLPRLNGFSLKIIYSPCENGFRIVTENCDCG